MKLGFEPRSVSAHSTGLSHHPAQIHLVLMAVALKGCGRFIFYRKESLSAGLPFREVFIKHFQNPHSLHIYSFLFVPHYRVVKFK